MEKLVTVSGSDSEELYNLSQEISQFVDSEEIEERLDGRYVHVYDRSDSAWNPEELMDELVDMCESVKASGISVVES